jgi:hypothetical protein
MSPSPITVLRYLLVSEKLKENGFRWDRAYFKVVKPEQQTISFDSEWKQFISIVSKITGVSFPEPSLAEKRNSPWEKYFQHVIDPGGNRLHENEHTFSDVLFEALRASLKVFVDPSLFGRNCIVLKNSHIGFGKGICRPQQGFEEAYLVSRDGRSQHGCFVFGSKTKQRKPSDAAKDDGEPQYFDDDMTASIVLKQDTAMCKMLEEYREPYYKEVELDSEIRRSLLGQAMIFSWDVMHCLARRGISVKSVPVVVLAGKTDLTDTNLVCCLDARMVIPEFYGSCFTGLFNRIVSFNGTGAVPYDRRYESVEKENDETLTPDATSKMTRDKLSIAIYIRTMRTGLEHAFAISKNRMKLNALLPPLSLCSLSLLESNVDATLVASSIPNANRFQGSRIKVYQGELFSLVSPTKDDFHSLSDMHWFDDAKPNDILNKKCLVKVSFVGFHNTFVRREKCSSGLDALHRVCDKEKNATLKQELAKVLLGYHCSGSMFLTMVMKDLRDEGFVALDHQKFRSDGKIPELWSAFSFLVKSLLLPMAKHDVVHADLRSTSQKTYNVLCRVCSANEIELRLIDFDSITCFKWLSDADLPDQETSVNWSALSYSDMNKGERDVSAFLYLFWQVLWIAYTWHPRIASAESDASSKERISDHFVYFLSMENRFVEFQNWLGSDTVAVLKSMNGKVITESSILTALEVLGNVFCETKHGNGLSDVDTSTP